MGRKKVRQSSSDCPCLALYLAHCPVVVPAPAPCLVPYLRYLCQHYLLLP